MAGHCGQYLCAAETVFIILMAAAVYPDKTGEGVPGGRKGIEYSKRKNCFGKRREKSCLVSNNGKDCEGIALHRFSI